MSYQIINVANKYDLELIEEFVESQKFNTKEDHVPLHDNLFSYDGVGFGITTYGDMPKHIVSIFEKCVDLIQSAVTEITNKPYDPPILGKSYIMKHPAGTGVPMHFANDRPENVFRSIVKWNDCEGGGTFKFKNYKIAKDLVAGDCIIFPETEDFLREITKVEKGNLLTSDFWNAPVGQSPYAGLEYENIRWGNPIWEES